MPYVLKNKSNAQIFTALLPNAYGLSYYGPLSWNDRASAEENYKFILQQMEVPLEEADRWELLEVSESQLRLCNVKLNNNPRKNLYVDDEGKFIVE
ncbi:hypothetical protein [Ammoniphilus sp. 3BR4]|uniref:hypothetical protein n=1 Tax=Ammoniphilus sp. 3BR4 TaxID=3158265 RepID=UPI003466BB14